MALQRDLKFEKWMVYRVLNLVVRFVSVLNTYLACVSKDTTSVFTTLTANASPVMPQKMQGVNVFDI
uniref:Uncharacterized protein n=1 Tax=Anguilla anguilla TaxID=7936 RepID=A0A0E9WLF2_ANGAN